VIPAFINPAAGNAESARNALLSTGGHFDIREVAPSQLSARIRDAIREGATRVVIAGGDGSVGGAADALAGSNVELAILPCGTLNHLAKDLHLPLDPDAPPRRLARGRAVSIDGATIFQKRPSKRRSVG